jgi:hypothetical protein
MSEELKEKAQEIFGADIFKEKKDISKKNTLYFLEEIRKINKTTEDWELFQSLEKNIKSLLSHKGEEFSLKFLVGWLEMTSTQENFWC